jgi:transmembrane sensor
MRSAKDIEAQAAGWLARLDGKVAGQWPPEFHAWLAGDAKHRVAFVRLEVAWKRLDALRQLRPVDQTLDEDLLAPRAGGHAGLWMHATVFGTARAESVGPLHQRYPASVPSTPRATRPFIPRFAIAALAIIVVSVSWLVFSDSHSRVYETTVGGHAHLALEDGSYVELNTGTRIRVKFSSSRREVALLRGEALFSVAHEADRPFEVRAAGVTARAVGTEFSVRLRADSRVETLVRQGRVLVLQPQRMLGITFGQHELRPTLEAGARALVDDHSASVVNVGVADIERRLRWTTGKAEFRGETVRDVVAELNRYSLHPIRITDPQTADKPFGGTFNTTDPESFVAGLASLYGASAFALAD